MHSRDSRTDRVVDMNPTTVDSLAVNVNYALIRIRTFLVAVTCAVASEEHVKSESINLFTSKFGGCREECKVGYPAPSAAQANYCDLRNN